MVHDIPHPPIPLPASDHQMPDGLDRLRQTQLCDKVHCILAEGIRDHLQGFRPVDERKELRGLRRVSRPVNLRAAVRVQSVDEADQEVGHVLPPEDYSEFCGMRLVAMAVMVSRSSEFHLEMSTHGAQARDFVALAHWEE